MRSLFSCLVALAMTAPAYTQTTPPAAPSVRADAIQKGLSFNWAAIPGTAWYQLEYRAHQTGPFVQLGTNYPASATSTAFRLPLHLFDWTYARYRVAACNSTGCTRSNEVSVSTLRTKAVGYFKDGRSVAGFRFGTNTALSPDGLNFVATSPNDLISSEGPSVKGGGLAIFQRTSTNGTWTHRSSLYPAVQPTENGGTEMHVAISADAGVIVLGMPQFFSEEFDEQSGEVFVFRFNGGTWVRTKLYSAQRGGFGRWVGVNDAGDTIAVASGDGNTAATPKRIFIYKLISGVWQPVRGISDGFQEACYYGTFSRDGSTVAEQCSRGQGDATRLYVRLHSGPNWSVREELPLDLGLYGQRGIDYANVGIGISANGDTVAANISRSYGPDPNMGPSEVHVFQKSGGGWTKTATLAPGAWRVNSQKDFYGLSVAVSGDGGTIAVGDSWDNGFGTGPRAAPLNPDPDHRSGAIYVYRFNNTWQLVNLIKPNVAATNPSTFGHDVSLNGNGQTLIVGFPDDGSEANGIGGNWNNYNSNGTASGGVFMY
jgi:hypothetical protein